MDFDRYVEGLERRRDRRGPENLVVLPRVESTNSLARAIVNEYRNEEQTLHPLLVLALEQSGGRGRQGRSWSSPPGKGVYASRIVTVGDAADLQTLPMLMGVGLCRALAPHLPSPCRLKWPNDLVVEVGGERKKIGGVLIEASARPGDGALAILGFGVNYLHGADDLPGFATSLVLLGGGVVSLVDLTWDLVEGVEAELAHMGDTAYAVRSYLAFTVHRPGETIVCRVGETLVEGALQGFDEAGRLLLESQGRQFPVSAGEVIEV